MNHDFYLASRSSRRVQLLRRAGFRFECRAADIDERAMPAEAPGDFARRMALEKARALLRRLESREVRPVLAADTDVSIDGHILGKPENRAHGIALLARLAGRVHEVHTAVAVCDGQRERVALSRTEVEFGAIRPDDAERYWSSGEPADKAGAYAIQGLASRWVRRIHGSYTGVVGLPMFETHCLLAEFGIEAGFPPAEVAA